MCVTLPKKGTRWCSQSEWTSMSRTTTIESCFSWNTASLRTFSTLSLYLKQETLNQHPCIPPPNCKGQTRQGRALRIGEPQRESTTTFSVVHEHGGFSLGGNTPFCEEEEGFSPAFRGLQKSLSTRILANALEEFDACGRHAACVPSSSR